MKLFLIDGHALIFKMYYAFLGRPMVNTKGIDTSILFGFTKYLVELIEREHPTHVAVSFDPPGGTFRNELYPAYKANRVETPQLVIDALEPLTKIVGAMNIPVLMIKGFEADDVIGSAAKRFVREGFDVYMVTPDKDYGQLVEAHIFQYKPGKSGSDNEILGEKEICDKWGIASTAQVIDILTLCGDSSDNVPGVQGVGPVGASKLLAKYGDLEGIYSHIGELTARQQELFRAAQDHIGLSKQLVTIKTDIPLEVSASDMMLNTSYGPGIISLMDLYEMPSLKSKIRRIASWSTSQPTSGPAAGGTLARIAAEGSTVASVVLEAESVDPPVLILLAKAAKAPRVAVNVRDGLMCAVAGGKCASGKPEEFRSLLEDPGVVKVGVDLKSLMNMLTEQGISLAGKLEDIELMHYLLNPERSHKLGALALGYLGVNLDEAASRQEASLFDDAHQDDGADLVKETLAADRLADCLSAEIDKLPGMRYLYDKIEEPLIGVLSRMEIAGVKIDLDSLKHYAEGLRTQMQGREAQIRQIADNPQLNVSSPRQIGELIFERLALDPKAKKPRNGNWSTDEQTLLEIPGGNPVIEAVLDYRGLRKLLSTYIEPFAGYISPVDGRVHTTFNQTLTSTGRLSSSNPNLQNIPIRTDQGREIRRAFVASDADSVMMSADYSQIELRLMAHFSSDSHMVEAFRNGVDVHSATAAKIFKVDVEKVTPDQRRVAKTANFGIIYGISPFGLSQRLKCSRQEAKQIINDYFASFPSIRGFIDATLVSARQNGYVETLFGRRRYIDDINSHNANLRSLAERNAVNAPIQGTAADIIKIAMVGVDSRLREQGLKSKMVLQIHDELLLEVPREEIELVRGILVSRMENVIELAVPLSVECNYGNNWLDAH